MQELLEVIEDEVRVSHRVVAQYTEKQDVSIANLINKNKKDIEEFGTLHFKNERVSNHGKGEQPKTYYLNEQQSTFLMTLLRNKPIVVEFKKRLVKEFYKLKERSDPIDPPKAENLLGVVLRLVENQQKQTEAIFELIGEMRSERLTAYLPHAVTQSPCIDGDQRKVLRSAIESKAKEIALTLGTSRQSVVPGIWVSFKNFFDLGDYGDLKRSSFNDAMNWVMMYEPRKMPVMPAV